MSCFLIFNHYYIFIHEQIIIFSSIIFKKHFHMSYVTCFFLFYFILFYHSHDYLLSFSTKFHCLQNSETLKLQNFNQYNFNADYNATHNDYIIKTTSASNLMKSIILFLILNQFIHMSFESE